MKIKIGNIEFKATIRWAEDLKPVLAFPNKLEKNFPAYYMFRDVYHNYEDRNTIVESSLRYDITYIPPSMIGDEYIKTFGHYHPKVNSVSYPELYEVIEGSAIFLIQKGIERIEEVIAVKAKKGDKVIIPPNYGHVTINPSNKTLKTANWVSRAFSSIYEPYIKRRGACYYLTTKGWMKNNNYRTVPPLKFAKSKAEKVLKIDKADKMYDLVKNIDRLEFLNKPENYPEIFEDLFNFE